MAKKEKGSSKGKTQAEGRRKCILLSVFLLCIPAAMAVVDGILLFFPASDGTLCAISPDSVENFICPANFLQTGHYGFTLSGNFLPSRYLPWFPLVFIMPFQAIFHDPLCGVYGIFFASLVLLAVTFSVTKLFSGSYAAASAVCGAIILMPKFTLLASSAMTEVPYLAVLMLLLLVWLRMYGNETLSWKSVLAFSLLAAWASSLRTTALPMLLLPFLLVLKRGKSAKEKFFLILLSVLPSAMLLVSSALFNKACFGFFTRSGYNFWCPVPYDYTSLVFNVSYLKGNFALLASEPWTWISLALLTVSIVRFFRGGRDDRLWTGAFVFMLLQTIVLVALYSCYFFRSTRFYLPAFVLMLPVGAAALQKLLSGTDGRRKVFAETVFFSVMAAVQFFAVSGLADAHGSVQTETRKEIVSFLKEASNVIPGGSVVVTAVDPALTEFFLCHESGKKITLVPFLRHGQEYASKIAAPVKVDDPDPVPQRPDEHFSPALLNSKTCFLPVRYAVSDDPMRLIVLSRREFVYFILPPDEAHRMVPSGIKTEKIGASSRSLELLKSL